MLVNWIPGGAHTFPTPRILWKSVFLFSMKRREKYFPCPERIPKRSCSQQRLKSFYVQYQGTTHSWCNNLIFALHYREEATLQWQIAGNNRQKHQFPHNVRHWQEECEPLLASNLQALNNLAQHGGTESFLQYSILKLSYKKPKVHKQYSILQNSA